MQQPPVQEPAMGSREFIGSCCVESLDKPFPATGAAAIGLHQLSLCGRDDPAQQVTPAKSHG